MTNDDSKHELLKQAERPDDNLVIELWTFLRENKKWWLLPILLVILVLGVFVVIGGGSAGPFIYTLF